MDGVWSARHFAAAGESAGLDLRLCQWVASAITDEDVDLASQLESLLSADLELDNALGRLK